MGASLHVHSEPLISIKLIHVWLDILTIKIKIKNKKKSNVFDGSFDCYTLYFKFTTDDLNLLTNIPFAMWGLQRQEKLKILAMAIHPTAQYPLREISRFCYESPDPHLLQLAPL